ncbi:hypothetical protein DICSQDRAFT_52749 [Dichomitus squalens LYAD-421 SS1]|uniref:uncharacterized protein n=1 Tax=Dichomitus squalens (strain LYAD-421) TaxID=732165 RepID=UPI00044112B9|nr:uncharacterized protein DICSQDRAFT_52749 [Dichomitus squalens LYAD-421 SS1]EJF64977.1 hypothetical protein DICSQDRAFT_52749 [Dichomitus squalens LYAD-421 SS1]
MRLQTNQDSTVEFYTLRGPLLGVPSNTRTRPRLRADSEELLTPVADPIAKLTRECSALRLKLATAERRERNSYNAQPPGYRTAPTSARTPPYHTLPLAATAESVLAHREQTRTSHLQGEVVKLAERHRALEKTLREMQDALRMKDREIEMLRAERDRLLAERDEGRAKSRSVSRERSQLSMADDYGMVSGNGRGRGDRHHQRHRDRSRSRRAMRRPDEVPPLPIGPAMAMDAEQYVRAQSMDIFLTKTDGWSGAQIIQAVDDLNAEINQFAAAATESCSFAKRAKAKGALTLTSALENTTPWLGPALSHILAFRDHTQDPILVQLALQASIVTCCARSLSLFCVGFPSKLDALLTRILIHMQTSEPQATSSRWRTLTHRSIRMLYPGLEEYAVTELVTTMLRWSSAVFTLCGSANAPTASDSSLHAQLRRIAEAVYKLARVTREDILSTTFEVLVVDSGTPFEPGKMLNKMREGEHDGDEHGSQIGADVDLVSLNGNGTGAAKANGAHDSGRVLCTTELGLRCVTRRELKGSGGGFAEAGPEGDAFESRLLLPPKVLLDSAMDVIERG